MRKRARIFEAHVVLAPAEDLPGQWIAHCLDFDVMSQGNSISHALEMIAEATLMVLHDDLQGGREPSLRRAPEECWEPFYALMTTGNRSAIAELAEEPAIAAAATILEFHAEIEERPASKVPMFYSREARGSSAPPPC